MDVFFQSSNKNQISLLEEPTRKNFGMGFYPFKGHRSPSINFLKSFDKRINISKWTYFSNQEKI